MHDSSGFSFNEDEIFHRIFSIFNGDIADIDHITASLKAIMSKYVGVFRTRKGLETALKEMNCLEEKFKVATISDKSLCWNVELQHYLELENMFISAFATIRSALWRTESRGAHWRDDYQENNNKFLGHTMVSMDKNSEILLRPVRMSKNNVDFYQPEGRNY